MMRLILVRHGETVDNVNGVAQGWSDSPLTETGRSQVGRLAQRLKDFEPTSIWSSTLPRALSTARAISAELSHEVHTMDDLREMNCGNWEGQSFQDVRINEKDLYEQWVSDPSVACPGGESFNDVARRMKNAIDSIVSEERAGSRPVIVSHGTAIRLVTCTLLSFPMQLSRKLLQQNAAINVLESHGNDYFLRTWNDSTHCMVEGHQ